MGQHQPSQGTAQYFTHFCVQNNADFGLQWVSLTHISNYGVAIYLWQGVPSKSESPTIGILLQIGELPKEDSWYVTFGKGQTVFTSTSATSCTLYAVDTDGTNILEFDSDGSVSIVPVASPGAKLSISTPPLPVVPIHHSD